jgi:hypothetical protein
MQFVQGARVVRLASVRAAHNAGSKLHISQGPLGSVPGLLRVRTRRLRTDRLAAGAAA